MGRTPCCEKTGLKKGPWTSEEDEKLVDYIQKHGDGNWRTLPKNAGLQRCGKSCRLRWTNYLRPDIKRGRFSFEEEEAIIQLHSILGNKWSAIAARLPGRTDNEIKNYWNTNIRKRLLRMGIDPVTHRPRLDILDLSSMFNNTRYYNATCLSTSQMNLSSMINPEILNLLAQMRNNNQMNNSSIQSTQVQTPIQNPIPNCTKMTTSIATNNVPILEEAQIMDHNFEEYPTNVTSFYEQNFSHWQSNGLVDIDQPIDFNFDPYGLQSLMSFAPSSSPPHFNSNSNSNSTTNVNGGGTDDERENYCSDMIDMELSDIYYVNQFMLAQTN